MNKTKITLKNILALLLSLCLTAASAAPAFADSSVYVIDSAEDLLDLQQKCALNSFSRGKSFVLGCDIDMQGAAIGSIMSFSGVLDGCGHSISGFSLSDDNFSCALFGYIEKGAIVRNLRIEAQICPESSCDYTAGLAAVNMGSIVNCSFSGLIRAGKTAGGIAAVNAEGGRIESCSCSADIESLSNAGGICGKNQGTVKDCSFSGRLNADSTWVDRGGPDISDPDSFQPGDPTGRNLGGIAGSSRGRIEGCVNDGTVGYMRSGENVGGIAGLSSGYIGDCVNNGRVSGKDDVGGIAGQMLPYIDYSAGRSFSGDIDSLQSITDKTLEDIDALTDTLTEGLSSLSSEADNVIDSADSAADSLDKTTEKNIDSANRLLDRLDYLEDELPDALDHMSEALRYGRHLSTELDDIREQLADTQIIGDGYLSDINDNRLVLESTAGGSLSASKLSPRAGELVTVYIKPDKGFSLRALSRSTTDSSGELPVDISGLNGKYSFTMPEDNVLISAEFGKDTAYYPVTSAGGSIIVKESKDRLWITVLPQPGYECTAISAGAEALAGSSFSGIVSAPVPEDTGEAVIVRAEFEYRGIGLPVTAPALSVSGSALLVCSSSAGGSLLCSEVSARPGDQVLFTMVPAEGYIPAAISIDAEDMSSSLSDGRLKYTLPEDASGIIRAEAEFSPVIVSIKSNFGGNAAYTTRGSSVIISAQPDTGRSAELACVKDSSGASIDVNPEGTDKWSFKAVPGEQYTAEISFSAVKNTVSAKDAYGDLKEQRGAMENFMSEAELIMNGIKDLLTGDNGMPVDLRSLSPEDITALEDLAAELAKSAGDCLDSTSQAAGDIKDLAVLAAAMSRTAELPDTDALNKALENAADYISKMSRELEKAADKGSDILRRQGKNEKLQVEGFDDDLRNSTDDLKDSLSRMNDIINTLSKDLDLRSENLKKDLQSGSDRLADVLRGISERTDSIRDVIDQGSLYTDRSAERPSDSRAARTVDCSNYGTVDGCKNTGGIAGAMDVEPLSGELDKENRGLTGDAYAVLSSCSNYGHISIKNSNGAGIAGLNSLGLISGCFSAGSVSGKQADCLGGIAGSSSACIKDCSSMTVLDGKQYIGGIAGKAEKVSGCLSMARISEDARRRGAILGAADSSSQNSYLGPSASAVSRNYFVSTGTQGIDGASYSSSAEPVSYEQMLAMKNAPEDFSLLKLICLDENMNVLLQKDIQYGQKFELPESSDMPARWEGIIPELADGNVVLTAADPELSKVLESSASIDGRPAGLAGGSFGEDAVLDIKAADEGSLPPLPAKGEPGFYKVSLYAPGKFVPGDIRLYAGEAEKIRAYRLSDAGDAWEEIPSEKQGSYVQLHMEHSSETYCLLAEKHKTSALGTAAGAAAAAGAAILLGKKKRKAQ